MQGNTRIAGLRGCVSAVIAPQISLDSLAFVEIILHQPTGVLYLACSTLLSREHWFPGLTQLNATGASTKDYVATYDPVTSRITRLTTPDFNDGRGLSLHGMDVVPSTSNPSELFVYLVNHRIPLGDANPVEVGADSVIEIFTTTVGGTTLKHKRTIENPIIVTPNSVSGSADGESFYFTNDHGVRIGLVCNSFPPRPSMCLIPISDQIPGVIGTQKLFSRLLPY